MSIARVWPNGVSSMPVDSKGRRILTSGDTAKLDAAISSALDKQATPQTLSGGVNLVAGPTSGAGVISLDVANTYIALTGGANSYYQTATGGRIKCGDNDFPQFSATRTRTPVFPLHESHPNPAGAGATVNQAGAGFSLQNLPGGIWPQTGITPVWSWYVDNGTEGLYCSTDTAGNNASANGCMIMPLTRLHDGATLTRVQVNLYVSAARTVLPTRYPQCAVYQYDPFYNVTSVVGPWTSVVTPGTIAAYKNGATSHWNGSPYSIVIPSLSWTIDMSRYTYHLVVLDENYAGEASITSGNVNLYTAAVVTQTMGSLRFQ